MKPRLILCVAAAHLVLSVRQPPAGNAVSNVLAYIARARKFSESRPNEEIAGVELTWAGDQVPLLASLEKAIDDLKGIHSGVLKRAELEVQVGMSHARVGLMDVAGVAPSALTPAACETFANAWVKQMAHLDPQTQLIRWQLLRNGRQLLVSCVDAKLFQTLKSFSGRHSLRFVSCRPAIMSVITGKGEEAIQRVTEATLVWIEAGPAEHRYGSVQMLQFGDEQLLASWRGWLPSSSGVDTLDESLKGALRRFQLRGKAGAGSAVRLQRWPELRTNGRRP